MKLNVSTFGTNVIHTSFVYSGEVFHGSAHSEMNFREVVQEVESRSIENLAASGINLLDFANILG